MRFEFDIVEYVECIEAYLAPTSMIRGVYTIDLLLTAMHDGAITLRYVVAYCSNEITESEVLEELSRIYAIRKVLRKRSLEY